MPRKTGPDHILLTPKLNQPHPPRDLVARPRLFRLLNHGLRSPLTLVVAPSGFGKTTLVSSWFDSRPTLAGDTPNPDLPAPLPAAWLTLDENDNDFCLFLRYFIAALRSLFPDAAADTLRLIDISPDPNPTTLGAALTNEIAALPAPFVLVLDNLHRIRSRALHNLLSGWIYSWPHPLHLVLISQRDPPLPLADLRANGLLTEIRSHDLRLTPAEAAQYMRRATSLALDDSILARLGQRFEGWIAGLKLAALALDRFESLEALKRTLSTQDIFQSGRLFETVFSRQPPDLQAFLPRIAILDEFDASLCAALVHPDDPAAPVDNLLRCIEESDLFVTRLDDRREWYRFHITFRQFLLSKLPPDEAGRLHLRAAHWFAGRGMVEPALAHAQASGSLELASQLVAQSLLPLLNREQHSLIGGRLALLPDSVIEQDPQLLLMRAWKALGEFDLGRILQDTARAEALLPGLPAAAEAQRPALLGQIAVLRGQAAFHTHQLELAATLNRQALEHLPEEWRYARGLAAIFKSMSFSIQGDFTRAERLLLELYQAAPVKTDLYALRLLLGLVFIYLHAAQFENARRTAEVMLQQARNGQLARLEGWSQCSLGYIHYLSNHLDAAEQHFLAGYELRYVTMRFSASTAMIGLGLVYQAQGRAAEARAILDQLSRFDIEVSGSEAPITAAARARLLLLQGDRETAGRWAEGFSPPQSVPPQMPGIEDPRLTWVRILVDGGRSQDLQQASAMLDELEALARRTHNTRWKIELAAQRALAEAARGDAAAAQRKLAEALHMVRRSGALRLLADAGPRMEVLLRQAAVTEADRPLVQAILAAFPPGAGLPVGRLEAPVTPGGAAVFPSGGPGQAVPVERLTRRELEILQQLAAPISMHEIAARLNISYATAKRHTATIYAKLDAHSRWEAVSAATRLGILAPPGILSQ